MKIISNVEVFALDRSIITAGYPMIADIETYLKDATVEKRKKTAEILANTTIGEGHDNFLCGIIVQFDLNFTLTAWKQAQRYSWLDFVSSTSTMHRIKTMNIRKQCSKYVREKAVENIEEIVEDYNNAIQELGPKHEKTKHFELEMYDNIPTGFHLLAGMTTNYRQLKTIYEQRRNHKLPIWREFCKWVETLPHSELITQAADKKIEHKKEMKRLKDENKKLKAMYQHLVDIGYPVDQLKEYITGDNNES